MVRSSATTSLAVTMDSPSGENSAVAGGELLVYDEGGDNEMPARAASGRARGSSKHSSGKPRTPSERCQELGDEADLGRDGIPLLGRRAGGKLWIYDEGGGNEMPARAASGRAG